VRRPALYLGQAREERLVALRLPDRRLVLVAAGRDERVRAGLALDKQAAARRRELEHSVREKYAVAETAVTSKEGSTGFWGGPAGRRPGRE
jgi:hypothetical protein